ncbi:MAG: hypothetical protein KDD65_19475, partial [Bacteroidetes bacterium]|nr:hypothetical protein [Bacteroidota bacterium]
MVESSRDYLVVGGYFTELGDVPTKAVARWDGDEWDAIGHGVDGTVNAIAIVGDSIFVAGDISAALQANGVVLET